MIPELPVRRFAPQRGAPRVRRPASSYSSKRRGRTAVVQLVAVGTIDLVLIVEMFHPATVRGIFTSMPMTITDLTATISSVTSWGAA